jgi:kynureninase
MRVTEPIAEDRFDLDEARRLDAADSLAPVHALFDLPEGIYLDGNSLGALPRATAAALHDVVRRQWGVDLVAGWNRHDWIGQPQRLGRLIAPLIGAGPDEVIVADTTSANLFKLIGAALLARPDRSTLLSEPGNFPTDLYVADGALRMLGDRRLRTVSADAIVDAIDEDTALVLLTHVHYKSGRKLDMAAITAAAHAKGALMLWDLSHSTGAVAVDLNGCDADLAVGCGYKYLNGGPGAPAYLFVAERLQSTLHSPLSGWMGHDAPFAFDDAYRPAPGIARFLCGTPPVLAMAALEHGLAPFADVDLPALFAKASALGALFIRQMDARCGDMGFTLASPRDDADRGGHVCYAHPHAYPICQALIARGVVGDFRAPDMLRMGFAPLTTRYADVWHAVEAIRDVVGTRVWDDPRFLARSKVT